MYTYPTAELGGLGNLDKNRKQILIYIKDFLKLIFLLETCLRIGIQFSSYSAFYVILTL